MHKIFSSSAPSCVSIANWLINFLKKYMAMVCVCVCVCVCVAGREVGRVVCPPGFCSLLQDS